MNVKKVLDKNIAATLLLICCICTFFVLAASQVNRLATDACFDTLDDATAQAAVNIRAQVESDRKQLDVIASLLAQHDTLDSEIVIRHLRSFRQSGSLAAVCLLLPDNHLSWGSGAENSPDVSLDYRDELSKIPYVSGVVPMPGNSETKAFYQAVPVEKDGQTIGILYGFTDLSDFAASLTVTAFGGNVQIYVADGETGDFLVDTWHKKLGNIFDEDLMKRKVKPGFDYLEMKNDFVEGNSGHLAFWSNTAGEYFYSYYMPVGVNRWMVQLTVLESVTFASAARIRHVLYFIAVTEVLLFAAYFLWVLGRVRKENAKKISGSPSHCICMTYSRPCLMRTRTRHDSPTRCKKSQIF